VIAPRFAPGIPLGIDSTSHLNKILFICNAFKAYGYVPSWSPDWYCGTPFLLLYPPLAYYLVFITSFIGAGAVVAYEAVDSLFYFLSILAVFYLSRKLGLSVFKSTLAMTIFSLTPVVIENYVFFDRYANTVALPASMLFIASLKMALDKERLSVWIPVASILLSFVVLTHHLSAIYVLAAGLLLSTVLGLTGNALRTFLRTVTVLLLAILMSSFWLVPFLETSGQLASNPFFNRTVTTSYVRLSFFLKDVLFAIFGIPQFVLAIISVAAVLFTLTGRRRILIIPVTFGVLLFVGMWLFEVSQETGFLILGQWLIPLSFLLMLFSIGYLGIRSARRLTRDYFFLSLWFILFLWVGLGYYAIPFVSLWGIQSLWKMLDIHRFWLFLAIPMSILSSSIFVDLYARLIREKKLLAGVLITLCLSSMVVGCYLRLSDYQDRQINDQIPKERVSNAPIPQALIDYFKSQTAQGRILAIRCPLWIYVLPNYVNKPLIDGWYPQEKLLEPLLNIDDYRINELEVHAQDERIDIWRNLICNSSNLDIAWVLIGNSDRNFHKIMLAGTGFEREIDVTYPRGNITVYRRPYQESFVQISPEGLGSVVLTREAPDRITLLLNLAKDANVTVKEAYHKSWHAEADGSLLRLERNSIGFIELQVPKEVHKISLIHSPNNNNLVILSLTTFVVLVSLILTKLAMARVRRTSSDGTSWSASNLAHFASTIIYFRLGIYMKGGFVRV